MPRTRNTQMAERNDDWEERMSKLEANHAELRSSVRAMEERVTQRLTEMEKNSNAKHERLLTLLEQKFEKQSMAPRTEEEVDGEGREADPGPESASRSSVKAITEPSSTNRLQGASLEEFRRSVKKVELPGFDGIDPAGWISRAEVYFKVQGTAPKVKVDLAQLCMEGPTIHWFLWLLENEPDVTWESFKTALLEHYAGAEFENPYYELSDLTQEGTVEEYIEQFVSLVSQIPKLPDAQYRAYFLHGLRREIRRRVYTLGPRSRVEMIQLARRVEKELIDEGVIKSSDKNYGGRGNLLNRTDKSNHYSRNSTDWSVTKGSGGTNLSHAKSGGNEISRDERDRDKGGNPRDKGFRYLPQQEFLERKQKGLCFKCGKPFHPMHQCPDQHLKVMLLDEEDEGGGGEVALAE